jgi:serine/threonine-protein kinase HipA
MQADMARSIENEWLCLRLLAAFGMDVAKAEMATFEDQRVLVVERFDRRLATDGSWIMRIPQEDLCQASGTPPGRKYESEGGPGLISLMRLLLGARDPADARKRFLKAQILFWLLAAPDGHAKNFSIFIERQGRYSLTPLYDVMSVYPILGHGKGRLAPENLKMAMAVTGDNRHYEWAKIQKRHWLSTAQKCGAEPLMRDAISEILERLPSAIREVSSSLPPNFPDAIATPVLDGLRLAAVRMV